MAWSQTNPQYTHETVVQNLVSLCKQLRKLPANFSWEDNQWNFKATGISSEQYGGHRYYTITGQGFCDFGIILVEESVINRAEVSVTKAESNNCFIIHCFKENNYNHNPALWALVGNHPLHVQPTD